VPPLPGVATFGVGHLWHQTHLRSQSLMDLDAVATAGAQWERHIRYQV